MGYRSDVALVLTGRGVEALKAQMSGLDERLVEEIDDLLALAEHHVHDGSGSECWLWESVKWYGDYPDIEFLERFMRRQDDDDYRFLRIGEEYEDIEVAGAFWGNPFDIDVSRRITFSAA